jgi:thymidylate synthase (FAD)
MTNQIIATLIDSMGSDLSVVNAARVSFGKKSALEEPFEDCDASLLRLKKGDTKLIKYLAKHKHISPFGHAFASFHVKAPVFVARQLVKHKFLRWNEISRRYVDNPPEFYTPDVWRGKSADKKQGSSGVCQPPMWIDSTMNQVLDLYDQMIHDGVAPEQARMVLPQSMMTEWYWSGSLDALAAMCKLRCEKDTQAETQEVAWQIYHTMEELFPVSWVALMESPY